MVPTWGLSGGRRTLSDGAAVACGIVDGALGVEDQQQPVVELVGAADQLAGDGRRACLGGASNAVLGDLEHVADLVHQQADRPSSVRTTTFIGAALGLAGRQAEPAPQVDAR